MSTARRILFVSSTIAGGSGRSQRALARALTDRGHEVRFLVDDERPAPPTRWLGEQLADAAARFHNSRILDDLSRRLGRRLTTIDHDGTELWATAFPENGLAEALRRFPADAVVGNSMLRYSWRRIRSTCLDADVPTVLYIRGVASFGGLDIEPDPADGIVANARSLVETVVARGHACSFVPSVVDTAATAVDSSREVALLINPIESHGIDLLWAVATALPEIPFVIQESWDLDDQQVAAIETEVARLPNVQFRRKQPPGPALYRDARLLLVPHRIDNRPRVIVEAQQNGIPAFVSDFGGLREALGTGGAVLPDDASAWVAAIRTAFDDDSQYAAWSRAARSESHRPELGPARIVDAFEAVVEAAIARRHAYPDVSHAAPLPAGSADGSS